MKSTTLSLMDQLRAIERGHLPSRALMDLGGGYAPPVPIASKGVGAKKAKPDKAVGLRREKSAIAGVCESEVDDARSLVTHFSQSSLLSSDSLRQMLSKPALGVVKESEKKASFAGMEHAGDAAALAKQICAELRQMNSAGIASTSRQAIETIAQQRQLSFTDAEILSTYVVGLYCPDVR